MEAQDKKIEKLTELENLLAEYKIHQAHNERIGKITKAAKYNRLIKNTKFKIQNIVKKGV